jgi:hypothetical protein
MSAYTMTVWVTGGAPGLSATNLNKIEQAIHDAHDELVAHVAVGGAQHPDATTSVAGFMSAADKVKINGGHGSGNNADTLDGNEPAAFAAAAHVGATGAAHGNATGSVAGFLTAADFSKLAGIEAGATADQSGAEIRSLLGDYITTAANSDTLDGLHDTGFLKNHGTLNTGFSAPFNGYARITAGQASAPDYGSHPVSTEVTLLSVGDAYSILQFAVSVDCNLAGVTAEDYLYVRVRRTAGWGKWRSIDTTTRET